MIKWLKEKLGITQLQQELDAVRESRKALEEALEHEQNRFSEVNNQLEAYRKKEETDKAKYESKEPWVDIRSADFNEARGVRIELDWNDAFIAHLKNSGLQGTSDDEIVQKWLAFLYQHLVEKLEVKIIDQKDEKKGISDYV